MTKVPDGCYLWTHKGEVIPVMLEGDTLYGGPPESFLAFLDEEKIPMEWENPIFQAKLALRTFRARKRDGFGPQLAGYCKTLERLEVGESLTIGKVIGENNLPGRELLMLTAEGKGGKFRYSITLGTKRSHLFCESSINGYLGDLLAVARGQYIPEFFPDKFMEETQTWERASPHM